MLNHVKTTYINIIITVEYNLPLWSHPMSKILRPECTAAMRSVRPPLSPWRKSVGNQALKAVVGSKLAAGFKVSTQLSIGTYWTTLKYRLEHWEPTAWIHQIHIQAMIQEDLHLRPRLNMTWTFSFGVIFKNGFLLLEVQQKWISHDFAISPAEPSCNRSQAILLAIEPCEQCYLDLWSDLGTSHQQCLALSRNRGFSSFLLGPFYWNQNVQDSSMNEKYEFQLNFWNRRMKDDLKRN